MTSNKILLLLVLPVVTSFVLTDHNCNYKEPLEARGTALFNVFCNITIDGEFESVIAYATIYNDHEVVQNRSIGFVSPGVKKEISIPFLVKTKGGYNMDIFTQMGDLVQIPSVLYFAEPPLKNWYNSLLFITFIIGMIAISVAAHKLVNKK